MSIFVNPLQFGPTEDLARYPRDPEGDAEKAASRGVDLLFTPAVEDMYRADRVVSIAATRLDRRWEGEIRPGHFAGMLTVVCKLLNIVQPDVAVFGQKDLQQAALVRAMVRDLDVPVQIAVAPIVRESDGLAMSSRNVYLSPDERRRALALSRALRAMTAAFDAGERSGEALVTTGRAVLDAERDVRVDYLAVVDAATLEPVATAERGAAALLAARVGATRLLDNAILGEPWPTGAAV
jgi:pantoate--beta-alanine ligase